MPSTPSTLDVAAVKARQHGTWSAGDYSAIGTTLQLTGELLCEAVDVAAGDSSSTSPPATATPPSPPLARRRGHGVGLCRAAPRPHRRPRRRRRPGRRAPTGRRRGPPVHRRTFDVVLSTFGVMFTPQPDVAAAELLRVCRPGGRIGLANWAPTSFVGTLFTIVGRYSPPPPGLRSPLEWGTPARLDELLGRGVSSLTVTRRAHVFRYRSARHWLDAFRTHYGPVLKAFAALDPAGRDHLDAELIALATASDTSTTGGLRIPSDYLEVVAVRSG